jgi:uncharacterized membrane protein
MRRRTAAALVLLLAAASAVALLSPWWAAGLLATASALALRKGRAGFLLFAVSTLVLGTWILGAWLSGNPLAPSREGMLAGLQGSIRLVAVLGANLALLSWVPAVRILDGLRLPPRATAVAAAAVIAAHDVGADLRRVALADRLRGARRGRLRRAGLWVPAVLAMALRRARARAEALALAGHRMPEGFVPLLAVAAIATASRLALAPVPHLKLTYLAVFLGGLLFGARVGALAAALAMALSNLLLTGLMPQAFVNVPAMAALGALGGALSRIDFSGRSRADRAAGALLAGATGVLATLLFSILADATDWLALPELRALGLPGLWARIASGLFFNIALGAALFNGILFAVAVGPTQRTLRAILPATAPAPPTLALGSPPADASAAK